MKENEKMVEVLLVDDDPMFNLISRTIIKHVGIADHAKAFTCGKALLSYLDSHRVLDRHIMILLDINMPILSGWDVLSVLEQHPLRDCLFVVIVTSSIDRSDEQKARSYPLVADFLIKPLQQASFNGIKSLLDRLH